MGLEQYTKPGVVVAVLGPRRLNVSSGGSDYTNLPCHESYGRVAKVGDKVQLTALSDAQWVVSMYLGDEDRLYIPPQPKVPVITIQGTAPVGQTQISGIYASQETYTQPASVTFVWTAPPPVPPSAGTVFLFRPPSSATWDDYYTGWRTDDNKVRQAGAGNAKGLWFYGTSAFAALSALTVNRCQLTVTRWSSYHGYPSAELHVRLHTYATQPGTQPAFLDEFVGPAVGLGETVTFDLPVAWGTALKAGTAAGVGLWAGGPDPLLNVYALGAGSGDSGLLTITTN